jgi:hypothetical protein
VVEHGNFLWEFDDELIEFYYYHYRATVLFNIYVWMIIFVTIMIMHHLAMLGVGTRTENTTPSSSAGSTSGSVELRGIRMTAGTYVTM